MSGNLISLLTLEEWLRPELVGIGRGGGALYLVLVLVRAPHRGLPVLPGVDGGHVSLLGLAASGCRPGRSK